MTLYEGYEFYKSIQGTKYDKNDLVVKEKLQEFRNNFATDIEELSAQDQKSIEHILKIEKNTQKNSINTNKNGMKKPLQCMIPQ